MKLRQKPQSGIWLVDFDDPETGKRKRVSTGTTDRAEAWRLARKIVNGEPVEAAPTRLIPGSKGGKTMREVFAECLNDADVWRHARAQATLRSNIKILDPLVGDLEVASVTRNTLRAVVASLEERGYAPATIKRKMDTLSKALTYAEQEEYIAVRPKGVTVKVDNLKNRVVSYDEEAAILRAIERRIEAEPARQWVRFKHLFIYLTDTACRLSEALLAEDSWIDSADDRLVVRLPRTVTKNAKPRAVPLSRRIEDSLPFLRASKVRDRLFPLTAGTAWYMFANIKADVKAEGLCDIEDVTLHTLRHTCLTRLIKGRMPLVRVSQWAGHSSVLITQQRYLHLDDGDLMEGLDILDRPPTNVVYLKDHG